MDHSDPDDLRPVTFSRGDVSEFLDDPEVIVEYIRAAVENEDPQALPIALGHVRKAMGMRGPATDFAIDRTLVDQAWDETADLRVGKLRRVLSAMGLRLSVERVAEDSSSPA